MLTNDDPFEEDWRRYPFELVRLVVDHADGGDKYSFIARFETEEAAWLAGTFLAELLPAEGDCKHIEYTARPQLEVWERASDVDWTTRSDCGHVFARNFKGLTKGIIDVLRAAREEHKREWDIWKSVPF